MTQQPSDVDTRPSGDAYRPPADFSAELHVVFSTLWSTMTTALHPFHIALLAAIIFGQYAIESGVTGLWNRLSDSSSVPVALHSELAPVRSAALVTSSPATNVSELPSVESFGLIESLGARESLGAGVFGAETLATRQSPTGPGIDHFGLLSRSRGVDSLVAEATAGSPADGLTWVGPHAVFLGYQAPWIRLLNSSGWDLLPAGIIAVGILALVTWGAILVCRRAAIGHAGQTETWLVTIQFCNRHYVDGLFSILTPLLVALVLALPIGVAGLFLLSDVVSTLGAVLAFLSAFLVLPIALILLGLGIGWPLMYPAIACEGRDSFESISRTFAYIFQRPLHAVGLAFLAIGMGIGLGLLIELFFDVAHFMFARALGLGANWFDLDRVAELQGRLDEQNGLIRYWTGPWITGVSSVFILLERAAHHAVFWGLITGIYLLLRRYVDQTALDEVYRLGQFSQLSAPLSKQANPEPGSAS